VSSLRVLGDPAVVGGAEGDEVVGRVVTALGAAAEVMHLGVAGAPAGGEEASPTAAVPFEDDLAHLGPAHLAR